MASKTGIKGKLIGLLVVGVLVVVGANILKPDVSPEPDPQENRGPKISPGAQVRKVRVELEWDPAVRGEHVEFQIFAGPFRLLSDRDNISPNANEFDVQAGTSVRVTAFQPRKGYLQCVIFSDGRLIADDFLEGRAGTVNCTGTA